tara:strand:+ start:305 stop:913 length:609 start_codon:yes stop_codon:yes gene_type:complete
MNSEKIFSNTRFLLSVFLIKNLPEDTGSEIAFCGRSNSGKSSVLNAITGNKKLAKTSKTPGRTKAINIFSLDLENTKRIADLPGYGFAKVSKKIQQEWWVLINFYLNNRLSLKGLVIIMDIRNPFRETDLSLINWCYQTEVPLLILLNKSDKLSRNKTIEEIKSAKNRLATLGIIGKVLPFSAKKGKGIDLVSKELCSWFYT